MASCVQSVKSYFRSSENKLAKIVNDSEGQDKILKLSASVASITLESARLSGASGHTLSQIQTAESRLLAARDVTGLLNVFRGTLFKTIDKAHQTGSLINGLREGKEEVELAKVVLEKDEKLKFHETAVGKTEMWLKLGENAGGIVAGASMMTAFSIARPLGFARKNFDVQLGKETTFLADSFPYIMSVNHVGSLVENSFKMVHLCQAFERAKKVAKTSNDNDKDAIDTEFTKKMTSTVMRWIEQVLELVGDGFLFARVPAPVWVKLPLGFTIASIGFARVWHDTK